MISEDDLPDLRVGRRPFALILAIEVGLGIIARIVYSLTIGRHLKLGLDAMRNSQELWMRNRDQAATDPVLLSVSVVDSLLSCSLPSMKVAPARTSGTNS